MFSPSQPTQSSVPLTAATSASASASASKHQSILPSLQINQPLIAPRVHTSQQGSLPFATSVLTSKVETKKPDTLSTDDDDNDRIRHQDLEQGYVHKCHLCNKSFKRKSWLKRHLLSHSPERHFSCPWCLSKHKRKDNLLQHMKLKHTDYVLQELRLHNVNVNGSDLKKLITRSNSNNIRTLLYEGRLNKDEVKKVLNSLIDRHNHV